MVRFALTYAVVTRFPYFENSFSNLGIHFSPEFEVKACSLKGNSLSYITSQKSAAPTED